MIKSEEFQLRFIMEKKYQPQKHETQIYTSWEKAKLFKANNKSKKEPFCIIMPPPNANAPLHIGHAMFVTIEDIITRYQRMKGKEVLWLPGADHAGILTQVVFERQLAKKGKIRHDLGRDRFYRQSYRFTQENKKIMYQQLKRLGASCDWSREKFTLDPKISKEVLKTFIQLYQDKLAYRGERMINWCPRCATALSDLEIEYQEEKSRLWFIKYPFLSKSKITGFSRFLVVATTRPETMLGDTAIAVNPQDKRYNEFIGRKVLLPIANREIPVVADPEVDPEFGTGLVKVTPAHDPVDWQIGQRHKLKALRVIGFDNKMTRQAGAEFAGLSIEKAREKILQALRKKDLILKEQKYCHSVGHCERCRTTIEPQVSLQWFIKIKPLAKLAIKSVESGKIKIIPERKFRKNFLKWLASLHDWCISRQIWWGHRLPIWYCGPQGLSELQKTMNPELVEKSKSSGCGQVVVTLTKPRKCPLCGKGSFIQDPDTFDTWFSSAQWPFTSLGYPQGADFKYFYPTAVMETGYEILPIWVARMMMLGSYRAGKIPFRVVYLHGMVRDALGQKMSKSKGNAINPLKVIEDYGADALRLALITGTAAGNDVSLSENKIKGYRNFTNKLWNINRFILMQLAEIKKTPFFEPQMKGLQKKDKEIIKRLNALIKNTTDNLDHYQFSTATGEIYQFIWHQLADKYIESLKLRLKKKDKVALSVLRHVFLSSLKLLHPFAPFITEALWSTTSRKKKDMLVVSSWPK